MGDQTTINARTGQLLCKFSDRAAVNARNRPEARNALSNELTPALRRMIKDRGDDVRVGAPYVALPSRSKTIGSASRWDAPKSSRLTTQWHSAGLDLEGEYSA
jgi:hypothetical protein